MMDHKTLLLLNDILAEDNADDRKGCTDIFKKIDNNANEPVEGKFTLTELLVIAESVKKSIIKFKDHESVLPILKAISECLKLDKIAGDGTRNTCPDCGSENISGGDIDIEGDYVWQKVTCEDCDVDWSEEYKAVGWEKIDHSNYYK